MSDRFTFKGRCVRYLLVLALVLVPAFAAAGGGKVTTSNDSTVIPSDTATIRCDSVPEMLSQTDPVYPVKAKKAGIETSLWVKAYVDITGTVRKAFVLKCDKPGYGFEEAALKAAYKNRFKPAKVGDKPVGVWVTYKVEFKIM